MATKSCTYRHPTFHPPQTCWSSWFQVCVALSKVQGQFPRAINDRDRVKLVTLREGMAVVAPLYLRILHLPCNHNPRYCSPQFPTPSTISVANPPECA